MHTQKTRYQILSGTFLLSKMIFLAQIHAIVLGATNVGNISKCDTLLDSSKYFYVDVDKDFDVIESLHQAMKSLEAEYAAQLSALKKAKASLTSSESKLLEIKNSWGEKFRELKFLALGGPPLAENPIKTALGHEIALCKADILVEKSKLSATEVKIQSVRTEIEKIEVGSLARRRDRFTEFVRQNPAYGLFVEDALGEQSLAEIHPDKRATVVFGVGADEDPGPYIFLIRQLVRSRRLVFIDGEDPAAANILKHFNFGVVAVTSRHHPEYGNQQLVMHSSYLRFRIFARSEILLVNPKSVLAAALILDSAPIVTIGLKKSPTIDGLADWADRANALGRVVTVPTFTELKPPVRPDSLAVSTASEPYPDFKGFEILDRSKEALAGLIETSNSRYARLTGAPSVPVAFFGGSLIDPQSESLVYSVAYFLARQGLGVVTGGAGGAMRAANSGAFDGGAESVGVPLDHSKLESEARTYTEFQTHTVATKSYSERIPLLMHQRALYVVAPGGRGTLREIAIALLELDQDTSDTSLLVFLESEYYAGLVEWLRSLELPRRVTDRIRVVDTLHDFSAVLAEARTLRPQDLASSGPPKPRHPNRGLPLNNQD